MGVEAWGEPFLAGKHGGRLLVVAPTGRVVATLAESPLQPAAAIYTTLDRDVQTKVERFGLGAFSGAIVLLQRDTGEVLAMVSSPGFDSNLFDPGNYNSEFLHLQRSAHPAPHSRHAGSVPAWLGIQDRHSLGRARVRVLHDRQLLSLHRLFP
jgi:penicillin-binding protein 2